jgi:hypothetical protein
MNKITYISLSIIVLSCGYQNKTDIGKEKYNSEKNKFCFENDTIKLLNEVIINPKKFISLNDSCVFQLVEIHKNYILNNMNNILGYKSLNAIIENSDGYLSEELLYLLVFLFENDYINLSNFLFESHLNKKSEFEILLKDAICVRIIDSNDKKKEVEKIKNFINSFNQPEINGYIKNLIETIDYERCS